MPLHLEVVTAERVVLTDEVDQLNVPTKDGIVGILPHHAPLLSMIDIGEMEIIKGKERTSFALSGGFMEVLNGRVNILADTVLRSDEIDEARAEQARQDAERRLREAVDPTEVARIEADLRRSIMMLRLAQRERLRRRS